MCAAWYAGRAGSASATRRPPGWLREERRGRGRIGPAELLRGGLGRRRRSRSGARVRAAACHGRGPRASPAGSSMRPSIGLLALAGGAVLDQAGRVDDALAQHAQREAKIELARIGRERGARIGIEAAVRDQEVAALELLDRLAERPRERAVDALVGEQALALRGAAARRRCRCRARRRAFQRA